MIDARATVLIVDDDEAFSRPLCECLHREGVDTKVAATLAAGRASLASACIRVVIVGWQLPDGTGIAFADEVLQTAAEDPVTVVMVAGTGNEDDAVAALRAGCVDYLTKDTRLEAIVLRIRRLLEMVCLRARVVQLEQACAHGRTVHGIDGKSIAAGELRDHIAAAASAAETTVLIEGETGTGKQLVARAIHEASARASEPYIEVDCTTLAANLFESELFGHERGAFTGATERKLGLAEVAGGGTLVLDEIGELDPRAQGKLLRVLQERKYRRVGGVKDMRADVRFIASTNRNLRAEVAAGRFRSDLYYRLRVFMIRVPPLRDRDDDVTILAERFVQDYGKRLGKPGVHLSPESLGALRAHLFPGNVRELQAMVEQAVVRARTSAIELSLTPSLAPPPTPASEVWTPIPILRGRPRLDIDENIATSIRSALLACGGNQSRAAVMLGMSRFALKRRLKQLAEHYDDGAPRSHVG